MRIGIIGNGTIGSALARGLAPRAPDLTIESTTRATASRNAALVRASDVVVVCVKPYDVESVLTDIAPALASEHVLVSVAASVATPQLRAWSGGRARVVRAMPNTPASVGLSMTVLAREERTCSRALETARSLFASFGRTAILDEAQMDAATAIGGCGPAYAFLMMEALIDGAIALGIPFDVAREMVAQTMLGSAALLLQSGAHPAALRHDVTTPAGRTIKGIVELERGGVRAALLNAALAAAG